MAEIETSTIIIIALAVVAGLLIVLTVFSFNIPFTTHTFKGFAKSINLGLDFGNGTRATYTVTNSDYSEYSDEEFLEKSVEIVQNLAIDEYTEARVYRIGDDKLVIEVPDTSVPADIAIGQLEIKTEATEEAETKLNGSHIKEAKFQMNGADYGVLITFTDEGAELIKNMTSSASSSSSVNIVFCLNKEYTNAMSVSTGQAVEDGYIYFTMTDKENAKLFASRVENSKYGINLEQVGESVTIYSNISTFGKVVCALVVVLMIAASIVYLVLKFNEMGWISSLALTFYALFNIITFALIPSFRLTMGSYLGMLFGYALAFAMTNILLEKYKSEFESGKKLNASFKSGYIKSLPTIADTFSICALFSVICLFIGTGYLFSFALTLFVGCLFGALFVLAVMLWFSRKYLKINNVNGAKLNFRKEVKTNDKETK